MRVIKFRAWNTLHNTMLYNFYLTSDGEFGVWNYEETQIIFNTKYPFELMQSTGLTDKNGKEIFEGDILNLRKVFGESLVISEVVWCNGWWGTKYSANSDWALGNYEAYQYEIIGNRWENPELLKGGK